MKRLFTLLTILIIIFANSVIVSADNAVTVTLCVVENVNNTTLYDNNSLTLDENSTALDALIKSGLNVTHKNGYVTDVNGYKEFGHGKMSGWTFYVNGEFSKVSASKYTLSNGDKIEWRYVVEQQTNTAALKTNNAPPNTNLTMQSNTFEQKAAGQTVSETATAAPSTTVAATAVNTTLSTTTAAEITYTTSKNYNPKAAQVTLDFLKANQGTFTPLVLSLFRQAVSDDLKQKVTDEITACDNPLDAERLIINAAALGIDIDKNLTDKCFNSEQIDKTGLNGVIFGLLSAKVNPPAENSKFTPEKLTETLISAQNTDGGFALNNGERSDVDITAMAATALSTVNTQAAITARNNAINYLSKVQNPDGGYSSYGVENCESAAQVVIALASNGISQTDKRFVKKAGAYDKLFDYYTGEGFSHEKGGKANTISSEQALLAIYAAEHNENPYTVKIEAHIEQINFPLIFICAGAVIVISAVVLFVLTRKGKSK